MYAVLRKSSAWDDLNGSLTSSKHRRVLPKFLEFLSIRLDFIYIILPRNWCERYQVLV